MSIGSYLHNVSGSLSIPDSSTDKTDFHDVVKILLIMSKFPNKQKRNLLLLFSLIGYAYTILLILNDYVPIVGLLSNIREHVPVSGENL